MNIEAQKTQIPTLAVGTYIPTPAFISIAAHAAVVFERNSGLVATTGRAQDPEAQEYARLFAAAPALLAICEETADALESNDPDLSLYFLAEQLRAAVAKARGGS